MLIGQGCRTVCDLDNFFNDINRHWDDFSYLMFYLKLSNIYLFLFLYLYCVKSLHLLAIDIIYSFYRLFKFLFLLNPPDIAANMWMPGMKAHDDDGEWGRVVALKHRSVRVLYHRIGIKQGPWTLDPYELVVFKQTKSFKLRCTFCFLLFLFLLVN